MLSFCDRAAAGTMVMVCDRPQSALINSTTDSNSTSIGTTTFNRSMIHAPLSGSTQQFAVL
jgi:hypothetical protein